jgi:hypothetical protein
MYCSISRSYPRSFGSHPGCALRLYWRRNAPIFFAIASLSFLDALCMTATEIVNSSVVGMDGRMFCETRASEFNAGHPGVFGWKPK